MYGRGSHDKLTDSGDWREHIVLTRAPLHAGGRAHRAVVPRSRSARWPACRRRSRAPSWRSARPICGEDFMRPGRTLASLGLGDLDRGAICKALLQRGLAMSARRHRLSRRRPHGARHRRRVRLCRPSRRARRLQGARRGATSRELPTRRSAKCATTLGHARRASACSTRRTSTASSPRVSVVPESDAQAALARCRRHLRRRAGGARPQARGAGARLAARRPDSRSSPRPPRPSWSTICRAPSRTPSASSTRTGSIRPFWCRWSSSRPARAPIPRVTARAEGAAGGHRQGAGRLRGAARLHRAAHPGAGHERGGAHGRGGRRQRRGHRQGDQVRLRLPLRRARHARVHRLGRRRHPLLRQPLSDRRARQRALRRAGDRRAQHGARAASG